MQYENIRSAVFVKRPNRFVAEVEIDGHREIVHVKNTGRCRELLLPGCEVWLTAPESKGRKTKYDLVAVRKNTGILFNIDSQAPNKLVGEWLAGQDYRKIISEFRYGNSRMDFYMEKDAGAAEPERYLMEVKGCTLEEGGIGYFPDAPTERGVKHIRELMKAKKEGYRAMLAFVIQMEGVREVRPNAVTQPEFALVMEEAKRVGVEILFFICRVEARELVIIEKREARGLHTDCFGLEA